MNNPTTFKKSLSTQKSISKITEKKINKFTDENKNDSNFMDANRNLNFLSNKINKIPNNNKSTATAAINNLKKEENIKAEDLILFYNDPKMRTKTLPENFNLDCLKHLDSSIERLPKKFHNANYCFKSIDDFSQIKQKFQKNEKYEINGKNDTNENDCEIQELEHFFKKKPEKCQENHYCIDNQIKPKTSEKNKSNFITERQKNNYLESNQNNLGNIINNRPTTTKNRSSLLKEK